MKTCPLCEKTYPSQHTTCPTDGALLIDSRELEPGTLIRGKYRIVRQLGRGGMGTVYLAEHILLGRQRALKFISSELSQDATFLRRFRREAQAATELLHPNVVQVVDLDQAEDGSPYIAMEYVDGPDLRRALAAGPFSIERAVAIARGIAQGLGAAHAKGIVHRDVKPENVLLAGSSGSLEIPKILDFGIAAMKETATVASRTHGLLLTPPYAAPEQWKGMPADELDGRTDLYALGGVLYEMLTGQTPFHAHNTEGWMYQHLHEQPQPPSTLRPEIAKWTGLDALVLRLLAKDRDQRFPSAATLLDKLVLAPAEVHTATVIQPAPPPRIQTIVEPQPTPIPPPPPIPPPAPKPVVPKPSPAPAPPQKLPIKWLAAAAVLILAVAGIWFATRSSTWTDPATGLTWAKKDNGSDVNWYQATDYCRNLQLDDHTDWRLPTIGELAGIYDPYARQVKGNLQLSGLQWSSSQENASGGAWIFTFYGGERNSLGLSGYERALCVRGSSSISSTPAVNPSPITTQPAPYGGTQPPPVSNPTSNAATLLVFCDLACNWKLDSNARGRIAAGGSTTAPLSLGKHLVTAATDDDLDKVQNEIDVKTPSQMIVHLSLQPVRDTRLKGAPGNAAQQLTEGRALYNQQRYEEARPLFHKACDGGNMDGCDWVGWLYQHSQGVTQDYAQARAFYQKACDGGNMAGCNNLGLLYDSGLGVTQDYAQARALYQKACNSGEMMGCYNLGSLYNKGQGVTKDNSQARVLYQKACNGGNMIACNNLGLLYQDGQGGNQDYATARALYQKACDGGEMMGCYNLGSIYDNGQGVTQDYVQARTLYQKACNGGVMLACYNLGSIYSNGQGVTQDYAQAHALYQKACNGGSMAGCNNLGLLYVNGQGGTQDYAQARVLYIKACNNGELMGCYNLGSLYDKGQGVTQDFAQARAFYQKACNGGIMIACYSLGSLYDKGHGVTQDFAQARALYLKACNGGNMVACNNLGVLYQDGHGVTQDNSQARTLYQKACNGGVQQACTNLKNLR